MSNSLAAGRRALWDAVNHWPPLQGKFKSKFCYERDNTVAGVHPKPWREAPTSPIECPAIAMFGTSVPLNWLTNKTADLEYTVSVAIWAAEPYADIVEELWQEVIRAAYQSHAADDTVPFVKRATGRAPKVEAARITTARFALQNNTQDENRAKVLQLTGGLTLYIKSSPLTE
jgi:hypothetical protein